MRNLKVKKLVLTALYSALALIAFCIESAFPPLIIPGAKMGISNVFILLSTISLGPVYGFLTLIAKVTLGSLFIGNFSAIIYSLPAGVLSLTVEILILYFIKKISVVSASIAGAVVNITVQNVVFCLYTSTFKYLAYLPYLALIGVIGGAVTGFAVYLLVKKLPYSPNVYNE